METLGVILSALGAAVTIAGTVLIWRVPGSKFTERDYTLGDYGGGRAVALYIDAIRKPTMLVIVGTSAQLLGLVLTQVA